MRSSLSFNRVVPIALFGFIVVFAAIIGYLAALSINGRQLGAGPSTAGQVAQSTPTPATSASYTMPMGGMQGGASMGSMRGGMMGGVLGDVPTGTMPMYQMTPMAGMQSGMPMAGMPMSGMASGSTAMSGMGCPGMTMSQSSGVYAQSTVTPGAQMPGACLDAAGAGTACPMLSGTAGAYGTPTVGTATPQPATSPATTPTPAPAPSLTPTPTMTMR